MWWLVRTPLAPGGTPDLDVEAFLTFKHRVPYQEQFQEETRQICRAVPQAKVIQRMHPAMEAVYKPLARRWPYIADAIRVLDDILRRMERHHRKQRPLLPRLRAADYVHTER